MVDLLISGGNLKFQCPLYNFHLWYIYSLNIEVYHYSERLSTNMTATLLVSMEEDGINTAQTYQRKVKNGKWKWFHPLQTKRTDKIGFQENNLHQAIHSATKWIRVEVELCTLYNVVECACKPRGKHAIYFLRSLLNILFGFGVRIRN